MSKRPSTSSINCPIPTKQAAKKQNLVGILIKYPVLLTKWSQFSDKLECPAQYQLRWEQGINNRTFQYYDVFSEMVNNWVERKSNQMTVGDLCCVLREIECVDVAEKLESDFNKDEIIQQLSAKKSVFLQNGKVNWPLKHGFFVPTKNFAGREEQLEEIKTNFNSKNNLMLITGFGGIGKTELCRKFAKDILTSCIWLHGENYEKLRESVLKLSNELGITNEGDPPISEYFEFIASFILQNSNRLVLVIDNVDVIYDEVVNVIRTTKMAKYEKMFVIVTSRDRNVLKRAGITMQLDVLSEVQARMMLRKSMSGLEDSDADTLAELVQYFPLALQQAVGYIKQQREHFRTPNYSITDYVNEFEVKKSQMLDHKLNEFEHDYSMTTLVTWDMTICKISEGAVEILKIIAYLDPDEVELDFFEKVCTQMGVVDFDLGLELLRNYCLLKIEEILSSKLGGIWSRKIEVISVHRLVQEVMRGKVDNDYAKTLFDSVFLVRWELFNHRVHFSDDVHLKSVYKFVWKCEMRFIYNFNDALFFLLVSDRIECAEKLTKLKYPNIQFGSEFGVEKREFIEKVVLWSFVCEDSRTNSEEIAKGEFNLDWEGVLNVNIIGVNVNVNYPLDWNHDADFFPLKTLEGCLQISKKYFDESSKITFFLKSLLVRALAKLDDIDKALSLCEELAIFSFEDDDGQANLLYRTIFFILSYLEQELTPSRLASLEKIMNNIVKTNPNDLIEWMKLEALWWDFKDDYKKALELYTKLVQKGNTGEKYKLIELRIMLTDFDSTTVDEFVREFGGVKFDYHFGSIYFRLRRLEKILEIYELNLGEDHELTINLKLVMAGKLHNGNTTEEKERCIELCEQVLRSKFDQKYGNAFEYLCWARNIQTDFDERRKILGNLLDSKRKELGNDHSNTKVVLKLFHNYQERESCIEFCEQVLRSKFDQKYGDTFWFLCKARNIEADFDERRKILQNLMESKLKESSLIKSFNSHLIP